MDLKREILYMKKFMMELRDELLPLIEHGHDKTRTEFKKKDYKPEK